MSARIAPDPRIDIVAVFAAAPGGGSPVPIVTNADGLTDAQMQAIAIDHGLEIGVVIQPEANSNANVALRFWVPSQTSSD